jgi:carbon-monoxide dehydrogenase large subunit
VTNKTPSNAYRGYGVPEAVFALESLVDKAAQELGVDRLAARRLMLLEDHDLPYTTAGGGILDSGSFRQAFDRAVELGTTSKARALQRTMDSGSKKSRVGVGFATYREGTAATHFTTSGHWTGQESCAIRMEPDGGFTVRTGMTDQGQGTMTFISTLAADALGVSVDEIRVVIGDTDLCPYGLGAWASRQAVVGGGAILAAATRVRDRIFTIAAHLLEVDPADLRIADGRVFVDGSEETATTLADVGRVANINTFMLPPGLDPGIDELAIYEPEMLEHVPRPDGRINAAAAWTNATHAAVVEVDIETGKVELLDYIVVHDCGTIFNPPIVDGQIVGGVVQGIGGALFEDLPFTEDGQPLATTFMDYLLPPCDAIPLITTEHFETPSPSLPLGMKGVGEGGTCGVLGAVGNAVTDALHEFDVRVTRTPITAPAVLRAIATRNESAL